MPEPGKGEKQNEFIGRCVKFVMDEGETDNKAALGKCYGIFRQAHKKSESIDTVIGKYLLTESPVNIAKVQKKIEQLKKKLQGSKMKENFGQKEVHDLSDSIQMDEYTREEYKKVLKMVDSFEDWCMNYTGK